MKFEMVSFLFSAVWLDLQNSAADVWNAYRQKVHAIAHHQPRPAQHLPATSHSRIISNTLIHTPPETRQATSQHNTSHPKPRSNTTSDTKKPYSHIGDTGHTK